MRVSGKDLGHRMGALIVDVTCTENLRFVERAVKHSDVRLQKAAACNVLIEGRLDLQEYLAACSEPVVSALIRSCREVLAPKVQDMLLERGHNNMSRYITQAWDKAVQSQDWWVRHNLCYNTQVPSEILHKLTTDSDPHICALAKGTLKARNRKSS